MARTVLHALSQRPSLTGSGITLDALVRHAAPDWNQVVVVGVPLEDPEPEVGGLPRGSIRPLVFGQGDLGFPVPGMSDVMPYPSTRFSRMTEVQLSAYRNAWSAHLSRVIHEEKPDLIHSHHVWLMSALLRDVAPDLPIVTQCHATGIRQMALCPHLADGVKQGCSQNDAFGVLHREHAEQLSEALGVSPERIHIVGAGFRSELFHGRGRAPDVGNQLLYVGKYSPAKGLPWLLDAVERLAPMIPGLTLHVAGSGAGPEAADLEQRMRSMAPVVKLHGQLAQPHLADLMRRCAICVLPSFYEGVPLVLVEGLACGCRLVATRLPGVEAELAPHLKDALELVDLPGLLDIDTPEPGDLPAFVDDLTRALQTSLARPPLDPPDEALRPFTWDAVFRRVEALWQQLLGS